MLQLRQTEINNKNNVLHFMLGCCVINLYDYIVIIIAALVGLEDKSTL